MSSVWCRKPFVWEPAPIFLKLTSEQEEIEEALEKVRAEWNAFSGPLPSANEQYVDRQAVNEQLLRDFLVYEKIPAENFPKLLEDAGVHIAMERLRVLMVRFPDYGAMLSRQKDPLGYQLKNVVVDLLRETMEGLVPGQVYGEHDRDFLILACFAGMEAVEEDAVLDQLVIRVKESVMRCFKRKCSDWDQFCCGYRCGASGASQGSDPRN